MTATAFAASKADRVETKQRRTLTDLIESAGYRTLALGPSKDPNAKVTILLLAPEGDTPLYAVKVPTSTAAERAVQAEASALRSLREAGLGVVEHTLPQAVELVEHRGMTALVMNALPGLPLSRLYAERRHTGSRSLVGRDFAVVGEWLCAFQDATLRDGAPEPARTGDRIRARFGDDPATDAAAEKIGELESQLSTQVQVSAAVHGDLWFGNVLVRDDRVSGVVDWESAAASGNPVRDLVRFALGYALYLDRRTRPGSAVRGHAGLVAGAWGAGVEFAVEGSGWFPELFQGFLRNGLGRLGAGAALWREHVLLGLAEVAATADDPAFAARHLELFRRLARQPAWRAAE